MEANPTPETEPSTQSVILTIIMNPDGTIRVDGPINNKVLSYGMLDLAKDAIFEHHMKLIQSKLIKPNGHGIMDFVRGKR